MTAQPSISLVKTANLPCFSYVGETIQYTFSIKNTGTVPLTKPFQVMDTYGFNDAIICPDVVTLVVGDTLICNGSYKITLNDIGLDILNQATASAQYQGQTVTSNEASVDVCYSTPPTPTEPPSRILDCSQFTIADTCNPHTECIFIDDNCKNK